MANKFTPVSSDETPLFTAANPGAVTSTPSAVGAGTAAAAGRVVIATDQTTIPVTEGVGVTIADASIYSAAGELTFYRAPRRSIFRWPAVFALSRWRWRRCLPRATPGAGTRHFVTDANATTFASVVAGGGANPVPVYSDDTDWRIG
jgi:hypothetical protein